MGLRGSNLAGGEANLAKALARGVSAVRAILRVGGSVRFGVSGVRNGVTGVKVTVG